MLWSVPYLLTNNCYCYFKTNTYFAIFQWIFWNDYKQSVFKNRCSWRENANNYDYTVINVRYKFLSPLVDPVSPRNGHSPEESAKAQVINQSIKPVNHTGFLCRLGHNFDYPDPGSVVKNPYPQNFTCCPLDVKTCKLICLILPRYLVSGSLSLCIQLYRYLYATPLHTHPVSVSLCRKPTLGGNHLRALVLCPFWATCMRL